MVRQHEAQYRSELCNKETEETSAPFKHNIYENYDYDIIHGFKEKLIEILQASKIGGAASTRPIWKILKLVVSKSPFQ